MLLRLYTQGFRCPPDQASLIELTYFALSVMTFSYLRLSKDDDREDVLDEPALEVLKARLPQCRERLELRDAVRQYQRRYQEYNALIEPIVSSQQPKLDPRTTLGLHFYECPMRSPPDGETMLRIATTGAELLGQFLVDHADYVRVLNGDGPVPRR